jgi:hypothetical protein
MLNLEYLDQKNAWRERLLVYLQFFVVALLAIVVKLFPANVKGSLM